MKKSVKKSCRKNVKTQPDGRDQIEVEPGNNINVDKEAKTYSEYQRKPQSKSARFTKAIAKPYRAPRVGMQGQRKKKF